MGRWYERDNFPLIRFRFPHLLLNVRVDIFSNSSMLSRSSVANFRAVAAQVRPRLRLPTWRPGVPQVFSTSAARRTTSDRHVLPAYGPVGVARALQAVPTACTPSPFSVCNTRLTLTTTFRGTGPGPGPTIFTHEFSLADRVALVSGANRGIGLEMALAFVEAGARAVYCVDLPERPGEEWVKVREWAKGFGGRPGTGGEGRLEYVSADVRDQVSSGRLCIMRGRAVDD